jgi:glycerol-3-phosphate acyltransferase PlsY
LVDAGLAKRASVACWWCAALVRAPSPSHRGWSLVWAGGAALLVVVRHYENIRRLMVGAERPIAA